MPTCCRLIHETKIGLFFLSLIVLFFACNKKEKIISEPCNSISIRFTTTASDPCLPDGTVTITSPLGSEYLYKVDNRPFQPNPYFDKLIGGVHTITIQSADGCKTDIKATVDTTSLMEGSLFTSVKNVLATHCFPCHTGNNPQAGYDWANSCDIVSKWERIKARAIDGDPTPMPASGFIPQAEKDKIINWINAGHRQTD